MWWVKSPAVALAWIGRQGTRAVALSVFAGLALPWLAAIARPAFTPSLFVLLCLAFLRVRPSRMRHHVERPGLVLAALAWTMIVTPLAAGLALTGLGLDVRAPGLFVALMLQTAAPPVISSPALAALMGLDAALSLAILIACAIATPLTATLFAAVFLGSALELSAGALGLRLLALLAGAALVAALVRRAAGQGWVDRQTERFDGLSVIALFVFAVAVMDGVVAFAIARPLAGLGLIGLAFAMALGLGALTALVFWRAGRAPALALAVSAGSRNLGLMIAATGGLVPELTWIYVAMAQFPIYLLPQLLKPLLARYGKRGSDS
jgi:BASS family bile acid:Na+ symporter